MKKLQKGSTIGLVAPANSVDKSKLESAVKNLQNLGYKVKLGKNVKKIFHSFAGTDQERAEDINEFFKDETVDAIMCVRGGYGSIRLLNLLDYDIIKENKKNFIGYSDVTSLHMALQKKCNLKTFHGPMAVSNFSGEYNKNTFEYFQNIMENSNEYFIDNFGEKIYFYNQLKAKGILVGGNLAVLSSNLGTEFDLDYQDKILFIEDIGEATYKIDRFLWQLKNCKVFEKVAGIVIGDFLDCQKSAESDMTLQEVFDSHFKNFNKPVCYNVKSGHCTPMLTLEFGELMELNGKNKTIKILK